MIEDGTKINKWEVLRRIGIGPHGHTLYECRCECGTVKHVRVDHLKRKVNPVLSCGCMRHRTGEEAPRFKHGMSRSSEHKSWSHMIERCTNENSVDWDLYGGRGVRVCERWQGEEGFANFIEDMGRKPSSKHSIDRRDNNGNYEPGNCRWATASQQARNRRSNHLITFNRKTQCVADWADELSLDRRLLFSRLDDGWSFERCIGVSELSSC